jgi:hypothetical protein
MVASIDKQVSTGKQEGHGALRWQEVVATRREEL